MGICNRHLVPLCVCAGLLLSGVAIAPGQAVRMRGGGMGRGMQGLPYQWPETDAFGNQWWIYQGGWIRQNGNMPIYSQGAALIVNGGQPSSNQAHFDENGDLVFDNMQVRNCVVTRRLQVNKEDGYVRIIDIFKNTSAQDQQLNISYTTSVNFGMQGSQNINDTKKKEQVLGIIGQDGQGRNFLELYAGRGSKVVPDVNAQPNNNQIGASLNLTVKAGKEIAVMHLHGVVASNDAGQKFVNNLKESQLLKDVPRPIRNLICNFSSGNNFIGEDLEILRGEAFDVVELRGGDCFKGTLREPVWKLNAFYGPVELASDKVIALVNVGDTRPRQLLVTLDGEIYGGKLSKETIALELSSGQVMQIPLSQIARIGYRKRVGESEEWTFEKPMVVLRSGERIGVEMPTADVEVATRYGSLNLKAPTLAAIVFRNDETGLPTIYLTDGSRFCGLVVPDSFEMKLSGAAQSPLVRFPTSTIAKLQLTTKIDDIDDTTPTLKLANDDVMVGSLSGEYKLDMAFDTMALSGPQIKKIVHSKTAPLDVQVTLWDDTTVSGQLEEQALDCQSRSGTPFKIPTALLIEYHQPEPTPSDSTAKQVEVLVQKLNSDGWKERDAAQTQLIQMGPPISGILKTQRSGQSPEVQQRIDTILGALKSAGAGSSHNAHQPVVDPDE